MTSSCNPPDLSWVFPCVLVVSLGAYHGFKHWLRYLRDKNNVRPQEVEK